MVLSLAQGFGSSVRSSTGRSSGGGHVRVMVRRAARDSAALGAAASLPALARVLRRAAGTDLSPPLALVLAVVAARPGIRLHAAAEHTALDLSTMSRHAAALERSGLLERRPDPSDRRGLLLHPTEAGSAVVREYMARAASLLDAATGGWDPGERRLLFELLPRLAAGVEDSG